jgi:HK97 gp10 family phage protein
MWKGRLRAAFVVSGGFSLATEVTGLNEMLAKMAAIRERVRGPGAKKAVRAGGNVIKVAMVKKTPVLIEKTAGSDSLNPGEVKAGIRVRASMEDGEPIALIGPTGKGGIIGKTAHLVEYGHRMVTGGKSKLDAAGKFQGGGKVHEKDVPAYPFLRPAFEESADAAMEAIALTLGEEVQEAAK